LLRRLGHTVMMPALSRVPSGVPARRIISRSNGRARARARRLIARWRALPARHPERFDLWLTYHCYYRKPDWLGPIATRRWCALCARRGLARAAPRHGRPDSAIAPSSARSPPPNWC